MTKKCNISNKFVLVKVIRRRQILKYLKTVGYICNIGIFGSQTEKSKKKPGPPNKEGEKCSSLKRRSLHILLSASHASSAGLRLKHISPARVGGYNGDAPWLVTACAFTERVYRELQTRAESRGRTHYQDHNSSYLNIVKSCCLRNSEKSPSTPPDRAVVSRL